MEHSKLVWITSGFKVRNSLFEIANYSGEIGLYLLENNEQVKNALIIITNFKMMFINIPGYKLDARNSYYSKKQLVIFKWNCYSIQFQNVNPYSYDSDQFEVDFRTADYEIEFANLVSINIHIGDKIKKFIFYPNQLSIELFGKLSVIVFDI